MIPQGSGRYTVFAGAHMPTAQSREVCAVGAGGASHARQWQFRSGRTGQAAQPARCRASPAAILRHPSDPGSLGRAARRQQRPRVRAAQHRRPRGPGWPGRDRCAPAGFGHGPAPAGPRTAARRAVCPAAAWPAPDRWRWADRPPPRGDVGHPGRPALRRRLCRGRGNPKGNLQHCRTGPHAGVALPQHAWSAPGHAAMSALGVPT